MRGKKVIHVTSIVQLHAAYRLAITRRKGFAVGGQLDLFPDRVTPRPPTKTRAAIELREAFPRRKRS